MAVRMTLATILEEEVSTPIGALPYQRQRIDVTIAIVSNHVI